ncbi:MAG: haloacid dehalogenase-like hydrolase [Colwellia sp.]|nr:haloacid dehalogenase-like hydrolase [Colwellia sp.]
MMVQKLIMTPRFFNKLLNKVVSVLILFIINMMCVAQAAEQTSVDQLVDPLPSWNESQAKSAIINFVTSVTMKGTPHFVSPEERIATFDNDGTLWSEQPVVQGMFLINQLEQKAKKDPSIRTIQPFKSILENDTEYLKSEDVSALFKLFSFTRAGINQEVFTQQVKTFFAEAKHPVLGVPIEQVVYKPMLELLAYLRAHGFKTYICSGGGIDFMRVVSTKLYGIPPEQVIGSSMKKELQQVEGRWELLITDTLNSINDKEIKPVNIDLHIGRRPLFAMGNVRSGGDIGMLSYSQGRKGISLQLLVNHDDEKREFAYAEKNNASLKAAKVNNWFVVSMQNDWKSVFNHR